MFAKPLCERVISVPFVIFGNLTFDTNVRCGETDGLCGLCHRCEEHCECEAGHGIAATHFSRRPM